MTGAVDVNQCPACGKRLSPVWRDRCNHCNTPFTPELIAARAATPAGGTYTPPAPDAPVITRRYRGKPDEIETARTADAAALAARGYYPKSQNYVPGAWGAGAWLLGVVLILLFGLGLLVLIYLVAVKPAGTLMVIYERTAAPAEPGPRPTLPVADRLDQLERLKAAGSVSEEEYAAKRADILREL